ncbi:hypothetical protein A2631_01465 [Candidatus Daviesbacteria bacterium RIFCSPHIGHO2_01_FULL_44_29]|nr:MAG: hypothetical protein A2631_01465 [Candidatus Daviesbacteria bacterium RIFCSPHIGHO2_01_FULL_44_29]OGE69924.1 MAG: hypothetical protein A3B55_00030 [Candidatus Daviesbacteria bacterium RIFCSPLOWO2_01_FULL_43_15]
MLIEKIKKEILIMVARDQNLRHSGKNDQKIDRANTKKLKKIISQIGWPKISQVSKKVAAGVWLLVQHSDHDLRFQKQCLNLMKKAEKEGEADKKLAAYLTDRVLVNENKKQIYGTQFYKDKKTGNKLIPRPIKNLKQVNILRKSVGLGPLVSYSKVLNRAVLQVENRSHTKVKSY